MGKVGAILHLLLCFAGLAAAAALAQGPQSPPSFAGVFLLIDGGSYTYNFSAAAAACQARNVTVATLEQMERALQRGLETCKFGWTAEQTAVIPRLASNPNCGQGKTGVVTWLVNPGKKFGVFCFNASDPGGAPNTSTLASSPSSTPWTRPSSSSSSSSSSPTSSPPLTTTKPPTASTSGAPVVTATPTTSPSSASSPTGPPTSTATALPPSSARVPERGTSKAAGVFVPTSSVSAPGFPPTVPVTPQTTVTPSTSPAEPFLGGVSRTLLVLGVVLLLLAAAALLCYYKLNIFSFWPAGRLKDDVETEMWKNDDSETDLHSRPEDEEEEDRKYSGDITLCVNPNFRVNASLV